MINKSKFTSIILILSLMLIGGACGSAGNHDPNFSENGFGDITGIAAGHYHTLMVKSDGSVWASGLNENGQLGTGSLEDSLVPVQVPGVLGIVSVAAGARHSLALDDGGVVWSWGQNSSGQLGDGTLDDSNMPVQTVGLQDVVSISAGWAHSLALKADGTVWAWGKNGYGQIGDSDPSDSTEPLQVIGLSNITAISAGSEHNIALASDGTVWTWGRNSAGQLGFGSSDWATHSTPDMVDGITDATAVAAGWGHTAALLKDGTVVMWGNNESGQLGDGTTDDHYMPLPVTDLSGVAAIASGYDHMLAVLSDGTLTAWGSNALGQLGDGNAFTFSSIPVQSENIGETSAIAGGLRHSIAADAAGYMWAWGANRNGELGIGSTDSYASPIPLQNP